MKQNIIIIPKGLGKIVIPKLIAKTFFKDDAFYVSEKKEIENMIENNEFSEKNVYVLGRLISDTMADGILYQADSFTIYGRKFNLEKLSYIKLNPKVEIIPEENGITIDLWNYFYSNDDDMPLFLTHYEDAVEAESLTQKDLNVLLYAESLHYGSIEFENLMDNNIEMSRVMKMGEVIFNSMEDDLRYIHNNIESNKVEVGNNKLQIVDNSIPPLMTFVYVLVHCRSYSLALAKDKAFLWINWSKLTYDDFSTYYKYFV